MPCCLIAGDLDDNSPARVMSKMAEKLPNAIFHIVKNAGHLVNIEQPELVNALLRDFFDQVI
jgi:3-oxoadipate enol-lactonase